MVESCIVYKFLSRMYKYECTNLCPENLELFIYFYNMPLEEWRSALERRGITYQGHWIR